MNCFPKPRPISLALLLVFLLAFLAACGSSSAGAPSGTAATPSKPLPSDVRVAYFPNITHVQPLVGLAKGMFQQELGTVKIAAKTFNAGPSEIEALFAGQVDIGYIGPSPAVNGYVQSRGDALRIAAGAVSGGASFIVRSDVNISSSRDLAGKKIASPQLGNTQDIALRSYLGQNGFKTKDKGGRVEVIPVANPDILSLFQRKELDGAWVPEPWAVRLVKEAGGRVLIDEKDLWPDGKFAATVVIVRRRFLQEQPEVVARWLRAHVKVTQWINQNPGEAAQLANKEIERLTSAKLDADVTAQAFSKLLVTYEPLTGSVKAAADHAFALGFLGSSKPNLDNLTDEAPLNKVLAELGLPAVK